MAPGNEAKTAREVNEGNHEELRIHPNSTVETVLSQIESLAGLIGFALQDVGTQPERILGSLMLVAEEVESRAAALRRSLPIEIINFAPAQDKIDQWGKITRA